MVRQTILIAGLIASFVDSSFASEEKLILDRGNGASDAELRMPAAGRGKIFQVESSSNLSSRVWNDWGDAFLGDNRSWQQSLDMNSSNAFFRVVRRNQPVAEFPLDGSLADESADARTLSVVGGGTAAWAEGQTAHDQAYSLDGSNMLDFNGPGPTNQLTLSMQVYLEDLQGTTPVLLDSGSGTGNIQLYFRDNQNGTYSGKDRDVGLVFKVGGNTGGNGAVDGTVETRYRRFGEHSADFIDDTGHARRLGQLWLQLTVMYDSSENRVDFYINGKHDSTQYFTSSQQPDVGNVRIGSLQSGANPLIARVSDIHLYPSILPPEKVQMLGDFRSDLWGNRDIDSWTTVRSFYVATNGNDSNDGSEGSPLLTLNAAIGKVNALGNNAPGSRIVFKPGLYRGGSATLTRDGSRFLPIVIEAETPGTVTLSGSEVFTDSWTQQTGQPGLQYGEVLGNINTGDPNPNSGTTTDLSETEDGIAPDTTEIYTGEIYDADGNISFTEDIDDKVRLYIDGTLVLSDDDWNIRTSTGNLNLQPGWHTFELRISNGSGGSGPSSLPGIGYDPDGGAAWIHPEDPGDGSLFRSSGSLWTHAWPYNFGRSTTEPVDHDTEVQFRREIVAIDGELMRPYSLLAHLQAGSDPRPGESHVRGSPRMTDEHAFMVDEATDTLYLRTTKNPNTAQVEVGIHEEILYSQHRNYIVVRGIKFQHAASFPPYKAALNLGRGSHLLVEDCEFSDNGSEGLLIQHGAADSIIRRSEGHRNGRNGFKFSQGCYNALVEDCITTHNLWRVDVGNYTSADPAGFAKVGWASRVYFNRVHIAHHNRIGYWSDIQNWDLTVDNCYLRDNRSCLWFEISALNQELINSSLYDNVNSSVHLSSENVRVINNVIQQSRTSAQWGLLTSLTTMRDEQSNIAPIYLAKDAVIRDNIISSHGATSGNLIGFNSDDPQGIADSMTSSNNTYYAPYAHSTQTPHFRVGKNVYKSMSEANAYYHDTSSELLPIGSRPFANDGAVRVSFDGSWTETPESRLALQVPLSLSRPIDEPITVDLIVEDITAMEGTDFRVLEEQTITFHPLQRWRVVNVMVLRDDLSENRESFRLRLVNPSNALLGDSVACTIEIPAN